jgi:cytochrome c
MGGLESNKIFAAILVACILALGAAIVADMAVEPERLEHNVYAIEVNEGSAAAASDSQTAAQKIEPISPILAKANVEHGEQLSKVCTSCHSFEKGGPNKVGPNLWGVVGGPHAHKDDYAYSDAMKAFPGKWDYESLNQFLAGPSKYLPGTKMGFAGYKKLQDRADVIAWLRTQADTPVPLP